MRYPYPLIALCLAGPPHLLGCDGARLDGEDPPLPTLTVDVASVKLISPWLYYGCALVRTGADKQPICMMEPTPASTLTLWISGESCEGVTVRGAEKLASKVAGGGCQIKIGATSLPTNGALVVNASPVHGVRPSGGLSFRLNVGLLRPGALWPRQAQLAQTEGDLATHVGELVQKCRSDDQPLDCLVALAKGQMRLDDADSARSTYHQVIQTAVAAGERSTAFEASIRLAELLRGAGLMTEARAQFGIAQALASPGSARDWVFWKYYWALFRQDEHQKEEVVKWLGSALEDSVKVDYPDLARAVTGSLARTLLQLGRFQEAERLLRAESFEALLQGTDDCKQASERASRGWLSANMVDATGDPAPWRSPQETLTSMFMQALAYRKRCPDSRYLFNVQLGLVVAAYLEDKPEAARKRIEEIGTPPSSAGAGDLLDFEDIKARLALKNGDPRSALVQFQQLDKDSRTQNRPYHRCQAAIGQLEASMDLNKPSADLQDLQGAVSQCINSKANSLQTQALEKRRSR